jgi:hypothetical protein
MYRMAIDLYNAAVEVPSIDVGPAARPVTPVE